MTVIVIVLVVEPPVLAAVTVYDVDDDITVGVPDISPVEGSIEIPVGKVGEIAQDITVPPVFAGVAVGDITESLVNMNDEGE